MVRISSAMCSGGSVWMAPTARFTARPAMTNTVRRWHELSGRLRDNPRNRACLSSCQRAEDCIGGTRCNRGSASRSTTSAAEDHRQQAGELLQAVLNMGSACRESSECDRVADNNWTAGHCGEDAHAVCAPRSVVWAPTTTRQSVRRAGRERVPSWNNRWIGQCEPQ